MARPKNRNPITISHGPPTIMSSGAANHGIAGRLAVMNMKAMNDNIGDELNRNTSSISYMNIDSAGVNSLEAVHNELLIYRVVVTGVGDNVVLAISAANGVPTEANSTVS
nr:uncharacterized protein A4U43_UnF8640 [Ipomoea batatas]